MSALVCRRPCLLQQNEVSVYDLKDHPDFQYRPGTVVIRVANFEGEDANCTAGQVLDNYPEGKVTTVSYVISILFSFDFCLIVVVWIVLI